MLKFSALDTSVYKVYTGIVMNSSVINIKTNPKIKNEAQKVAGELGFSLSSLINGYLRQLIKTKTAHFSLSESNPSEYMLKALKESEMDVRAGRGRSFKSAKAAISFLDKIIDEDGN